MELEMKLERVVQVQCVRFAGTVALAERRDEIVAVLKAIEELGGAAEPRDLAGYLLPEGFEVAAERLLLIAESRGLVAQDSGRFRLTSEGREARDRAQVMVARDGTWHAWIASDPLLRFPLIHVDFAKPGSAFDERRGPQSLGAGGQGAPRPTGSMPVLRDLVRVSGALLLKEGKRAMIEDVGAECQLMPCRDALKLRWRLQSSGARSLQAVGKLALENESSDQSSIDAALEPPEADFGEVFEQLRSEARIQGTWDRKSSVLRCAFDPKLEPGAVQSMRRTVRAAQLNLNHKRLGSFDDVAVHEVPMAAADSQSAQEWVRHRLLGSIQDHQTERRFQRLLAEARRPFAEFQFAIPDRHSLLHETGGRRLRDARRSKRVWHLQAPLDWKL
ncbi:MAG: hypothetical protein U0625_12715 [Phycisphaerales bacterium]